LVRLQIRFGQVEENSKRAQTGIKIHFLASQVGLDTMRNMDYFPYWIARAVIIL
jgi:hypothetical protein